MTLLHYSCAVIEATWGSDHATHFLLRNRMDGRDGKIRGGHTQAGSPNSLIKKQQVVYINLFNGRFSDHKSSRTWLARNTCHKKQLGTRSHYIRYLNSGIFVVIPSRLFDSPDDLEIQDYGLRVDSCHVLVLVYFSVIISMFKNFSSPHIWCWGLSGAGCWGLPCLSGCIVRKSFLKYSPIHGITPPQLLILLKLERGCSMLLLGHPIGVAIRFFYFAVSDMFWSEFI